MFFLQAHTLVLFPLITPKEVSKYFQGRKKYYFVDLSEKGQNTTENVLQSAESV